MINPVATVPLYAIPDTHCIMSVWQELVKQHIKNTKGLKK